MTALTRTGTYTPQFAVGVALGSVLRPCVRSGDGRVVEIPATRVAFGALLRTAARRGQFGSGYWRQYPCACAARFCPTPVHLSAFTA
jgi:hypothetical protein